MLAAVFKYKQRRNNKTEETKKQKKKENGSGTKKVEKERKAGKVQQVVEGGSVQVGTSEKPRRCQPSPLRKKIQVCLYLVV